MSRQLLIAFGLLVTLSTAAAAQAARSWVSGVGDDANPCSRTAPCKTFAGAISKTAAKGEINVLDPGPFGIVTITKSISITSEGMEAGVLAAGTNGIIVNATAGDEVVLRGLDIEGSGTGLNGIHILSAGSVFIEDTQVRDFTQAGISVEPTAATKLYLNDVTLSDNDIGLSLKAASATIRAFIDGSHIIQNVTAGIKVDGANTRTILNHSVLAGSGSDIVMVNGGKIESYQNNVIRSGAPNVTSTLK